MSRRTLDVLSSAGGLIVVVILLVAGGLLTWGHSFVNSNVRDQLARQEISFPTSAAFAQAKVGTEITPAMVPYLGKYAGQQMLTGQQAEAYADHFIANHLAAMPYGGVYSKISAASIASPSNTSLTALKQTSFQGTTLRGLLLEAYAFSKMGQVMLWGAIASFVLAALMLLLVGLGVQHARGTAPEKQVLAPEPEPGLLPPPKAHSATSAELRTSRASLTSAIELPSQVHRSCRRDAAAATGAGTDPVRTHSRRYR